MIKFSHKTTETPQYSPPLLLFFLPVLDEGSAESLSRNPGGLGDGGREGEPFKHLLLRPVSRLEAQLLLALN